MLCETWNKELILMITGLPTHWWKLRFLMVRAKFNFQTYFRQFTLALNFIDGWSNCFNWKSWYFFQLCKRGFGKHVTFLNLPNMKLIPNKQTPKAKYWPQFKYDVIQLFSCQVCIIKDPKMMLVFYTYSCSEKIYENSCCKLPLKEFWITMQPHSLYIIQTQCKFSHILLYF